MELEVENRRPVDGQRRPGVEEDMRKLNIMEDIAEGRQQ